MTKEERKLASKLLECIPTNWCDPLLTGDEKVIHMVDGKYDCGDIERLLQAIRKNMEKAIGI